MLAIALAVLFGLVLGQPEKERPPGRDELNQPVTAVKGDCDPGIDFEAWQSASPPSGEFDLVQSHVFIRHGARTNWNTRRCYNAPYSNYVQTCGQSLAGVPYDAMTGDTETGGLHFVVNRINSTEYFPGNCMTGQLLKVGWDMEFRHGGGLHKRYAEKSKKSYKVLPPALNQYTFDQLNEAFYMRSDDEQRVQQSALGFFTGLYPESRDEKMTGGLKIPLWTMDLYYEIIKTNPRVCPQWGVNKANARSSRQWEAQRKVFQPTLDKLNTIIYGGGLEFEDSDFFYDCLNVRICNDWPLPPTVDQSLFDDVSTNYSWVFNLYNKFPNWRNGTRFQNGPLLRLVKERIEAKLATANPLANANRVYLYAGHDTGPISPLLGFFHYKLGHWAPYASLIAIEVFKSKISGKLFVLTSFNGKVIQLPAPCDGKRFGMCSYGAFQKYWADVIPTADECIKME